MDLEQYKNEEMIKSYQLFKKYKDNEKFSINDFYTLDLNSPHGCPISGDYNQYWHFLPLYKSFIVRIYPIKNEKDFEKIYGLNVPYLKYLRDRGRIKLLLEKSPEYYTNLDYLYPLLESKPPVVAYRYSAFLTAYCLNWNNYLNEGKDFLSGIHNPVFDVLVEGLESEDLSDYASDYADLKAFGYDDITNLIRKVAIINQTAAKNLLTIYNMFLLRPIDMALDGLALTNKTDYQAYLENVRIYQEISKKIFPVNVDVGKSLIEMCDLHLPNQMKDILKIDAKEFQKAYLSLSDVINRKVSISDINDETTAFLEAIQETNESVDSFISDHKKVSDSIIYTSTSVGLVGPTAAILTGNSILAGLIGLSSMSAIASPISNLILKLKYPNHILFISKIRK